MVTLASKLQSYKVWVNLQEYRLVESGCERLKLFTRETLCTWGFVSGTALNPHRPPRTHQEVYKCGHLDSARAILLFLQDKSVQKHILSNVLYHFHNLHCKGKTDPKTELYQKPHQQALTIRAGLRTRTHTVSGQTEYMIHTSKPHKRNNTWSGWI